jgi:putative RNA 2'-phosphotransferase
MTKSSSKFRCREERYEVARYLVSILREFAIPLGLPVDSFGYVDVDLILSNLRNRFPSVDKEHIKEIVEKDAQNRFELRSDCIRARTGHRFPVSVPSEPIQPPEFLFHGTSPEAATKILESGISRMGKAHVHLSTTCERAKRIGYRKTAHPVILRVKAKEAYERGIHFWRSGQRAPDGEVFLSDDIPAVFVTILT